MSSVCLVVQPSASMVLKLKPRNLPTVLGELRTRTKVLPNRLDASPCSKPNPFGTSNVRLTKLHPPLIVLRPKLPNYPLQWFWGSKPPNLPISTRVTPMPTPTTRFRSHTMTTYCQLITHALPLLWLLDWTPVASTGTPHRRPLSCLYICTSRAKRSHTRWQSLITQGRRSPLILYVTSYYC